MQDSTLDELFQRCIVPDIEDGSLSVPTNYDQLYKQAVHTLPFLEPSEWKRLVELTNDHFMSKTEHKQAEALRWAEDMLAEQPSLQYVSTRMPEYLAAYVNNYDAERVTAARWPRKRAECVVRLVIASGADKTTRLTTILALRRQFRESGREKRARIRKANQDNGTIARAHALHIWLPLVESDWSDDFVELSRRTRDKLRQQRSLLQYISRRKRTMQTEMDLERNMQSMQHYLDSQ